MKLFFFISIRNVISTWSSGTGGAGIAGSLSYAGLIDLGLSPVTTLLIMLVVPALEAIAFWIILRRPDEVIHKDSSDIDGENQGNNSDQTRDVDDNTPFTFKQKMQYLPSLLIFIIPLITVYLFEYFINQGLVSFST